MIRTILLNMLAMAMYMAVVGGLMWMGCVLWLDPPIIYSSWETKQCVYIENADGSRESCDTYDKEKRYLHKWVY